MQGTCKFQVKNEKFFEYMNFITLLLQKGAKIFVKHENNKDNYIQYKSKLIEPTTNYINNSNDNNTAFLLLKLAIETFQDEGDICQLIGDIDSRVKDKIFKGKDNNLLHIACCKGNLQVISSIINKFKIGSTERKSINAKDKDGNTPLHIAIRNTTVESTKTKSGLEIVELLLQYKADISGKTFLDLRLPAKIRK